MTAFTLPRLAPSECAWVCASAKSRRGAESASPPCCVRAGPHRAPSLEALARHRHGPASSVLGSAALYGRGQHRVVLLRVQLDPAQPTRV
jgi:hypothetical protein